MYTGIIQTIGEVAALENKGSHLSYSVKLPDDWLQNLQLGASVSIDGVCQTVVKIEGNQVFFDAIGETLSRTTLCSLKSGSLVNVERSGKIGDEVGGHLMAGHVSCTASILTIVDNAYTFKCPQEYMKYLFSKGFIAINGASLTLVDVNRKENTFSVHLIPETLARTTLGQKKVGASVNLEFDPLIQAAVETVLNVLGTSGACLPQH